MQVSSRKRLPLQLHVTTVFLMLLALVGGALGWLSYARSAQIIEASASDIFGRIAREASAEFRHILTPPQTSVTLLSEQRVVRARSLGERLDSLGFMARALDASPAATSLYVGYESGDFFMLRALRSPAAQKHIKAPQGTRYMVQSVEHQPGGVRGNFLYFDGELRLIEKEERADYTNYDPRTRDWYKLASSRSGIVRTAPYVFYSNGKIGITAAKSSAVRGAIVGIDIELETIATLLAEQKVTPGTEIALFDGQRRVLAYEHLARVVRQDGASGQPRLATIDELGVGALSEITRSINWAHSGGKPRLESLTIGDSLWHAASIVLQSADERQLALAFAVPDAELLAEARAMRNQLLVTTLVVLLCAIPLTMLMARSIARPIRQLADEAESIRGFDFSRPIGVRSMVREVDELAQTMQGMKRTIRRFLDISAAVAAEDDFDRLMPRLLNEMIESSQAQGGLLCLAEANGTQLQPVLTSAGGETRPINAATASALDACPALLQQTIGDQHGGVRAGVVSANELAALGDATLHLGALASAGPAIAVPLFSRGHKLVGALLLFGAQHNDAAKLSFLGALSGTAAISLETRELIKAQKALFEAFIRLIASAIDAKSPYTGGHCARVPELTKMLARAACDANEGPFRDFKLDEGEWEAVHVAAWLHDCGKVTTPEFVVDKATKLEAIYDRIHEVRMRFEVLKRDAEIAMHKALAAGADPTAAHDELITHLRALDDEFAFVAACNEGGEFMAPEHLERLHRIAERTWQRTLDDRIGISHEELQRKAITPPRPLPATERLLADKPEHRIARSEADQLMPGNRWGFRMQTPALLYDRGELSNLSIARGTLTPEDRYKINDHIVQTIVMLSQLPFPKHLQHVPEIAGGHHEKMDGSGYPRGLRREEMSPVARMMAIADIFEALTAVDRPYKQGKKLSEAIRIMALMKKDQHIDPELFELFLRSGVYRDYAERFMQPQYIDEVDLTQYLTDPNDEDGARSGADGRIAPHTATAQ
ncbi:HAMP domain-containing protein [Niveibacterium sp. 24ML]|uniref:HD domain-containing phosphohydrolase n=1 Tax=Niveibacterium sp. 24ML TaxID=2985512 RepID=UPI00226F135A|nr:HD domain-containing phosphohydrolase [Niveibacterium sp. 24ML]MCX9158457.1 HAMP domain-containing protein [Niveibacterium sp. 24ML]